MRKVINPTKQKSSIFLRFFYNTHLGRFFLKIFISRPVFSKFIGAFLSTRVSKCLIKSLIKSGNIDVSKYEVDNVKCYNDFFTRKLKNEYKNISETGLIAPCDSKLTAYKIDENSVFTVKGSEYSLAEILENDELAKEFIGGYCLIFRLCVDDYHRYCYVDNCNEIEHKKIKGKLHTVRPLAFHKYNVYRQNSRDYAVLDTENFGKVIQMEVGALCVGKIVNHSEEKVKISDTSPTQMEILTDTKGENEDKFSHKRGEEKGYFKFGGSTVIVLVKDVEIDNEIIENTEKGLETCVSYGEKIADKI